MRIYLVDTEYDKKRMIQYRALAHLEQTDLELQLSTDRGCVSLRDAWPHPSLPVRAIDLKRPVGDVLLLGARGFVVTKPFCTVLGSIVADCEQLPVQMIDSGEEYTLLNFNKCVDCLDEARTQWDITLGGRKSFVRKYEFIASRLPISSLFKIPSGWAPMCIERVPGSLDEFKGVYESFNGRGVEFREIWNDLGEPVEPLTIPKFRS